MQLLLSLLATSAGLAQPWRGVSVACSGTAECSEVLVQALAPLGRPTTLGPNAQLVSTLFLTIKQV